MSKEGNIRRGGLAGKMAGFTPEPPGSVWEGVSSQLGGGNSRRRLFIILTAAAGLALALTVGVTFLNRDLQQEYATQMTQDPAKSDEKQAVEGAAGSEELSADRLAKEDAVKAAEEYIRREKLSADKPVIGMEETGRPAGRLQGREQKPRLEEQAKIAVREVFEEKTTREEQILVAQGGPQLSVDDNSQAVDFMEEQVSETRDTKETEEQETGRMAVLSDSLKKLTDPELLAELEHQDQRTGGRWQLGASLSPLYNYRDVSSQTDYQRMLANNSETARLTYAGGVQVSYSASERVTVESGLFYTRMGVNIGDYSSFKNGWYSDRIESSAGGAFENIVSISNSMGTIVSDHNDLYLSNSSGTEATTDYHMLFPEQMMVDNAVVENFSQSLEYLEIPVNMKFLLVDRSLQVQLIGGVSTNVMVSNSISANSVNGTVEIGNLQNLRGMSYSGNAGIGFAYDLYENFSLSIEPKFRYFLHSVNSDLLPSTRPYTFGLYTGVNYTF